MSVSFKAILACSFVCPFVFMINLVLNQFMYKQRLSLAVMSLDSLAAGVFYFLILSLPLFVAYIRQRKVLS